MIKPRNYLGHDIYSHYIYCFWHYVRKDKICWTLIIFIKSWLWNMITPYLGFEKPALLELNLSRKLIYLYWPYCTCTVVLSHKNGMYFVSKIVLTFCEKKIVLLKFKAKGQEFPKFLRSVEQFIQTLNPQKMFWTRLLF